MLGSFLLELMVVYKKISFVSTGGILSNFPPIYLCIQSSAIKIHLAVSAISHVNYEHAFIVDLAAYLLIFHFPFEDQLVHTLLGSSWTR